jgi:hypothetical protein
MNYEMNGKLALDLAKNLSTIKEHHLQGSPMVERLAHFILANNFRDMESLNELVEGLMAARAPSENDYYALTPESLLLNNLLAEDLKPWAEKLRRKFFGKVEAPYGTYDEAAQWIINYAAPGRPIIVDSNYLKGGHTLYAEVNYDNYRIVVANIGSPLEKIISASHELVEELQIGLDWNSLIFFVLADIPPFIPPLEVEIDIRDLILPSGRKICSRQATAKIRVGFNLNNLRELYNELRRDLHLTKKKGLDERHLQLCKLVQRKGRTPKGKGTVAFWTSVMQAWNELYPDHQYKNWKGAKIAYERLIGKINRDYSQ